MENIAQYAKSSATIHAYARTVTGAFQDGLDMAGRAIRENVRDGAAWYVKGLALCYLGRMKESLHALKEALHLEPRFRGFAEFWRTRGIALGEIGEDEAALASLDRAVAGNPPDALALHAMSLVLRRLKRYQEALVSIQRVTDRPDAKASAWADTGVIFSEMGRYEDALAAFNKALLLEQTAGLWYDKALVLARGKHAAQEVLEALEQSLQMDPDRAEARLLRGAVLNSMRALPQ